VKTKGPINQLELLSKGYCRVSIKYGMAARIDRPDWKEHMARQHSPWSEKEGMEWVAALGRSAEDQYRRVYSKDVIELGNGRAKFLPTSHGTTTGYRL
jgi:hypothetical protein